MRNFIEKEVGPDYVPIWATNTWQNIKGVLAGNTLLAQMQLSKLFKGMKENDCLFPCKTTRVKSVLESQYEDYTFRRNENYTNMVILSFSRR